MRPRPHAPAREELVGEVTDIVFANEANGFGVVELTGRQRADGARAAGPLAGLVRGQPVRLVGRWTDHERYGPTFETVFYELSSPRTVDGLVTFLASDRFQGVGDVLARRLVTAFGLDVGTVIETEPERLVSVRGVSQGLAERIAAGWREAGALAALVQRLAAVGVPAATATALHRHFGERAGDALDEDPYALLAVRGARWAHAEALARSMGLMPLDERRLRAGAVAAHRELCARDGHTTVDTATLVAAAGRLLRVDDGAVSEGLDLAAAAGALTVETAGEQRWWYTPEDLAAEQGLADQLARLRRSTSRVTPAAGDLGLDEGLTAEQAEAVRAALRHPLTVLTGGPGTGKTRTVLEVVRACEAADLRVALCAPTGRAAKRMEELTGRSATTIHRLLEAQPVVGRDDGDGRTGEGVGGPAAGGGRRAGGQGGREAFRFGYGARRRLPYDLVVADEWSMADTRLAYALAAAIPDGAHLLVVGDADQLPSVGPGAVLRDLQALPLTTGEDPVVRSVQLTTIHRQAASSRIVTLAHELNAGAMVRPRGRDGDVFAVPQSTGGIADRVAEIVAQRAPAFFGCVPSDVQVLAPMYRGPAGVDRLNERLKDRLNPAAGRPAVAAFHEGDRVVQTRNDADLDVANGDIGEVVATDATERTVEVAFPHGTVTYDYARAGDLAPAWCLTVHKAQGGEWPVVVLVLDASHRPMLWRELVYTGVTRASRGLLLVGDPALLGAAAQRTGSGARQRRTLLAGRLAVAGRRLTG